jgi:hypothetical protein
MSATSTDGKIGSCGEKNKEAGYNSGSPRPLRKTVVGRSR